MKTCVVRRVALLIHLAGLGVQPVSADDLTLRSEAALNPLKLVGKAGLTGFRQHPLFDPSRQEARPPEPPAALPPPSPVAEPEPPPSVHLVGIINGAENLAVVRLDTSAKTSVLATGDKLGDWIVTVTQRGLSLANDRQTLSYGLFTKGGANAPEAGGVPVSSPMPAAGPPP